MGAILSFQMEIYMLLLVYIVVEDLSGHLHGDAEDIIGYLALII